MKIIKIFNFVYISLLFITGCTSSFNSSNMQYSNKFFKVKKLQSDKFIENSSKEIKKFQLIKRRKRKSDKKEEHRFKYKINIDRFYLKNLNKMFKSSIVNKIEINIDFSNKEYMQIKKMYNTKKSKKIKFPNSSLNRSLLYLLLLMNLFTCGESGPYSYGGCMTVCCAATALELGPSCVLLCHEPCFTFAGPWLP